MFKNRALGTKIIAGFLFVTALVAVAGGVGYRGLRIVGHALYTVGDEEAPLVDMANEMKLALAMARDTMGEFKSATSALATDNAQALDGIVKTYQQAMSEFDTFGEAVLEGKTLENGTVVIKTDSAELADLVRQADRVHNDKFQVAAETMMQAGKELLQRAAESKAAMTAMEAVFGEVLTGSTAVEGMVSAEIAKRAREGNIDEEAQAILREDVPLGDLANEIKLTLAETRIALEEALQTRDPAELDGVEKQYKEEVASFDRLIEAMLNGGTLDGTTVVATDNEQIRAAAKQMDEKHAAFQQKAETLLAAHRAAVVQADKAEQAMARLDTAGEEADLVLDRVEEAVNKEMAAAKAEGVSGRESATFWLVGVTTTAVVLGMLIGIFLTRSITKPIKEIFKGLKTFSNIELRETGETFKRIIQGLTEGSDQVYDAAGQVSSASQQLAEGASEQASSLEETSSALEQMAAMTRTNAENAKQANDLSGQAKQAAQSGDHTMAQLNAAMTAINESSGQISKIIKVIEEIAFQTNLLALNAAVEAARAGEHGKGFAVVADEVRNLAQRAAQAARETTALIESSVNKAKEGTQVAGEVGKSLSAIVGDVSKVSDLINGIAQASQEQAQGVDQITTAVSQMDKVTQQNASGAEESASAAEQLSAQAQAVKGIVNELVTVVSGAAERNQDTAPAGPTLKRTGKKAAAVRPTPASVAAHQPAGRRATHAAARKADEFLPIGKGDDLKEF